MQAPWVHVLLVLGAGVVSAFQVGKATAALTTVQADLGLSLAVASWLLSAFAIVGALVGVAIGLAVDHAGARRMAVAGLFLQGLCSGLGALSQSATLLLVTRTLEGFGFLAVTVAAPTLIVHLTSPRDRDRAMAAWATFMPFGMTGILIAAPLLDHIGWRGFWLLNAVLLLAYGALVQAFIPAAHATHGSLRQLATDVREIMTAGGPWILAGLFAVFSSTFFAVFGFLPALLADRLSVSESLGSVLSGIAIAASAGGNLVCGQLLTRGFERSRILLVSFSLLALCALGIFPALLPGVAAYILSVVFSFVSGFIPVVVIDAAPRHAPRPELVGAAMGFVMQGNNAGLVVGPAAAGLVASTWGWPHVSLLAVGFAVAASVLILLLRRRSAEPAPAR